jgi:hypothetical protein
MSFLMAAPEMVATAATDVAAVGSTLSAAHMAAAASTVAVLPAAADEVSASIAQVFSRAAQEYHALAGQAAAFNQSFVQHLTASARSYAAAEAANAASLIPSPSAIADLPGQLSNALTNAWNTLFTYVNFFANALYGTAILGIFVAYFSLIFAGLTLAYEILLLQFRLLSTFGVIFPFPL